MTVTTADPGAVLAIASLLPVDPRAPWSSRSRKAGACILPALAVMSIVAFTASGETPPSRIEWRAAAEFAAWQWGLAPLHALLDPGSWGWRTTLLLTLPKLTLVVWALRHASGTQRHMLIVVLLLDLGNAIVLGIARHRVGLAAVANSRDHYLGLLCLLPFAAVGFEALLERIRFRAIRIAAATLCVAALAYHVAHPWPREIEDFAARRGRTTREILLHALNPPPMGAVPGMPLLSTARAKELIGRYQLH